jgi:hypothetical protein
MTDDHPVLMYDESTGDCEYVLVRQSLQNVCFLSEPAKDAIEHKHGPDSRYGECALCSILEDVLARELSSKRAERGSYPGSSHPECTAIVDFNADCYCAPL